MNKLKTFFYILKQSISNINYYNSAANARFSYLFKYIVLFSIIVSICINIALAYFGLQLSNNFPKAYSYFKSGVYQIYPKGLEITLTDGELSTNKSEPVLIKVPEDFKKILYLTDSKLKDDKEVQQFFSDYNLIVIDPQAKVEDIEKYKTLALFSKNSYATVSRNSDSQKGISYEFHNYKKDNKITKINYNTSVSLLNEATTMFEKEILPKIKLFFTVSLYLIWIVLGGFIIVSNLINHLILSLVGFIITKLLKVNYSYSQIYKMGMPLMPIFITLSAISLFIAIPMLPLAKLILYILVVVLALNKYKENIAINTGVTPK